jgi:hypothetical protein
MIVASQPQRLYNHIKVRSRKVSMQPGRLASGASCILIVY